MILSLTFSSLGAFSELNFFIAYCKLRITLRRYCYVIKANLLFFYNNPVHLTLNLSVILFNMTQIAGMIEVSVLPIAKYIVLFFCKSSYSLSLAYYMHFVNKSIKPF